MTIKRLLSRYYCPEHENVRVYPFDTIELAIGRTYKTLAPVVGKNGGGILLSTANTSGHRFAYCWVGENFVEAVRVTQHELVQRYLRRRGIPSRIASGIRPNAVEAQLEQQREQRGSA